MAPPIKRGRGGKSFTWTEDARTSLLEICVDYLTTRGNAHSFKLGEIVTLFYQRVGVEVSKDVLRNKLVSQKKEYILWKKLKGSETGLGYDAATGHILAPPQWWENKIKENPTYKKFRITGVLPAVEELWSRIFDGTVATGERCTDAGPSMPGRSSSSSCPIPKRSKSVCKQDVVVEQLCNIGDACKKYSAVLDKVSQGGSVSSPRPEYNEEDALKVLYRMAYQGLLERHGDLFSWAALWLLEKGRRRMFLNDENDEGRLRLLEAAYDSQSPP